MGTSFYTLVMGILFFNIGVILIFLFLKNIDACINVLGINFIFAVSLIFLLRMTLPLEFSFTLVIPSKDIYPHLRDVFVKTYILQGISIFNFIVTLLIAIGIILFVKNIKEYMNYRKTIVNLSTSVSEEVEYIYTKVLSDFKIKKPPLLIQNDIVSVPCLAGFFKPIIALPLWDFSEEELYYILRHEVIHYVNKDIWVKLLCTFIKSMLWWNLPVYLMKRMLTQILEIRCDSKVCRDLNEVQKGEYTLAILDVAKNTSKPKAGFNAHYYFSAIARNNNGTKCIKQRVNLIFKMKPSKHKKLISSVSIAIIAMFIFFSYTFVIQPQYGPPEGFDEGCKELSVIVEDEVYILYADGEFYRLIDESELTGFKLQGVEFYYR